MIVLDLNGSLEGLIFHEYHLLELIAELPEAHLFLFWSLGSALFLVSRLYLFASTPVLERLMDLVAELPQADSFLERSAFERLKTLILPVSGLQFFEVSYVGGY